MGISWFSGVLVDNKTPLNSIIFLSETAGISSSIHLTSLSKDVMLFSAPFVLFPVSDNHVITTSDWFSTLLIILIFVVIAKSVDLFFF